MLALVLGVVWAGYTLEEWGRLRLRACTNDIGWAELVVPGRIVGPVPCSGGPAPADKDKSQKTYPIGPGGGDFAGGGASGSYTSPPPTPDGARPPWLPNLGAGRGAGT